MAVPAGFKLVSDPQSASNIPAGFRAVDPQQDDSGLGIGEAITGAANLAAAVPVELGRLGVQGLSTVGGLINPFIPQQEAVEAGKALAAEIPSQLTQDSRRYAKPASRKSTNIFCSCL